MNNQLQHLSQALVSEKPMSWADWYMQVAGRSFAAPVIADDVSAFPKLGYFKPDLPRNPHAFAYTIHASHFADVEAFLLAKGATAVEAGEADSGAGAPAPTPTNNMGVTKKEHDTIELVISDSGEVLEIPKRLGHGDDSSFIDWVNITFHLSTACRYSSALNKLDQLSIIRVMSAKLEMIFGYGVTDEGGNGCNYYKRSFILGDKWGHILIGGQNDTIMVMISGNGCAAAASGWESRLYDFLKNEAIRPKITRIDLAYDDLNGEQYSVDEALADHRLGLYSRTNRRPKCECIGDWDLPDGRGRTFYVGVRTSDRYLRVYEKGMQLGAKWHKWVRVELELKSKDTLIPFEILLSAGAYLAAAYPALEWISEHKADRMLTKATVTEIGINKQIEITKKQQGNAIGALVEIFGPEEALRLITRNDKVPDRLKTHDFRFSAEPIHKKHEWLSAQELFEKMDANPSSNYDQEFFDDEFVYDEFNQSWQQAKIFQPEAAPF